MQKVHCHFCNILTINIYKKLQLIVSIKFQKEAHAHHTFPLQYLFTIGYLNIYRFEGGPPIFKENSTSFLLLYISRFINNNGTITHNRKLFQVIFKLIINNLYFPFSLATTYGISFDFLNSYLDVSIHCLLKFTKNSFS